MQYVDDSTLLDKLSDFNNRNVSLNKELEKKSVWLNINRLLLNTSKSKFMFFNQHQKPVTIPNIMIINNDLQCIDMWGASVTER